MTTALLIIDLQNDFISGSMGLPKSEEIVPLINDLRSCNWDVIALSQDSHLPDHVSFAASHPGAEMYSHKQIPTPDAEPLRTHGEAFHPDLEVAETDIVQKKGEQVNVDSYSGFFDNFKGAQTGLSQQLRDRGVTTIFVCGLCFDFCVGFSACDASTLGFESYLIEDLSRAFAPESEAEMRKSLDEHNVKVVTSDFVKEYLSNPTPITRKTSSVEELDELHQTRAQKAGSLYGCEKALAAGVRRVTSNFANYE
eukprot:gene1079-4897_t